MADGHKTIRWPDGSTTSAPTFGALLEAIRREQWQDYGKLRFRRELIRRAHNWSGYHVPLLCTNETFMRELAKAGLFAITEDK